MSSWIAAATSYSTNNRIMMPFYVYYSMFGFQRIGDLAWAAGDMQARGFLLGGTSGRTTLNGEGLQHEDGHSHILAGTIPNCISYDPTFAHEVGVILHHGLKRMVEKQDNVFYYLTLLNENYPHAGPAAPAPRSEIIKGMYLLQEGAKKTPRVNLLGSGTILRESIAAQGAARERLGRRRQRLELPELQRAGARRPGLRALEPAAPDRASRACPSSTAAAREARRPGDRLDRLHEELRRADPRLHAEGPHLQGARHRRLRPQRLPHQAARALRGQPPLHRRRGAEGAGRGGHACRRRRWPRRSPSTGSTPTRSTRCTPEQRAPETRHGHWWKCKVPDIGDFKDVEVIEVLVKPGDTVKAEQSADHGRERQGVDGDSVERSRRGQGDEGQARRQGQRRDRRCWCSRPRAAPRRAAPAPARRQPRPLPQRRQAPRRRPSPAPRAGGGASGGGGPSRSSCPTSATSTKSR